MKRSFLPSCAMQRHAFAFVLAATLSACNTSPPPAPLNVPEPAGDPADDAGIALWPDEPFRSQAPEPGPAPKLRVPDVERFTLSNGLEVYFVPETQLPIARMWLEFDVGAVNDPAKKAGMHRLCFDLLDEGTRALDKVQWESKLDDRALGVSSSASLERANVSARSLVSELPAALEAVREVLSSPGLRKADFERLRDQRIDGLEQQKAMATSVSARLLPSLVYGAAHPYGRIETETSLKKISPRDCARLAKSLGPKGARLFVAAKTDRASLEQTLEAGLGAWKGAAPKPRAAVAPSPAFRKLVFVDMPGSAQSTISVAALGPQRDANDYAATSIMTRILGGSFSSRLNMNLREDKGFAYGARGSFRYQRHASHLSAGARVRADATVEAVTEVLREVAGVREGPIQKSELTRERDGALAALPGAFGTATQTLATFRSLVFFGLPLDWYQQHAEALRALDLDAVENSGRKHLPTDDYLVLVVGDASVARAGLETLAKDRELEFVAVDADGVPVP